MEDGLLGTLQTYALPHWPFVIMSFALGATGQFFKKKVWTFERAKTGAFWMFMYTTLGIHAPLTGALLGALGAPASPGVDNTWLARALYHFGAGAMASWTFAAWAHFMRSRGIVLAESMAPPPVQSEPGSRACDKDVCMAQVGVTPKEICGIKRPCHIHEGAIDEYTPEAPPPIGHGKQVFRPRQGSK